MWPHGFGLFVQDIGGASRNRVQECKISQANKVFDMQHLVESVYQHVAVLCSTWTLCDVHDFMMRNRCMWFRAAANSSTRNCVLLLRSKCFYFLGWKPRHERPCCRTSLTTRRLREQECRPIRAQTRVLVWKGLGPGALKTTVPAT